MPSLSHSAPASNLELSQIGGWTVLKEPRRSPTNDSQDSDASEESKSPGEKRRAKKPASPPRFAKSPRISGGVAFAGAARFIPTNSQFASCPGTLRKRQPVVSDSATSSPGAQQTAKTSIPYTPQNTCGFPPLKPGPRHLVSSRSLPALGKWKSLLDRRPGTSSSQPVYKSNSMDSDSSDSLPDPLALLSSSFAKPVQNNNVGKGKEKAIENIMRKEPKSNSLGSLTSQKKFLHSDPGPSMGSMASENEVIVISSDSDDDPRSTLRKSQRARLSRQRHAKDCTSKAYLTDSDGAIDLTSDAETSFPSVKTPPAMPRGGTGTTEDLFISSEGLKIARSSSTEQNMHTSRASSGITEVPVLPSGSILPLPANFSGAEGTKSGVSASSYFPTVPSQSSPSVHGASSLEPTQTIVPTSSSSHGVSLPSRGNSLNPQFPDGSPEQTHASEQGRPSAVGEKSTPRLVELEVIDLCSDSEAIEVDDLLLPSESPDFRSKRYEMPPDSTNQYDEDVSTDPHPCVLHPTADSSSRELSSPLPPLFVGGPQMTHDENILGSMDVMTSVPQGSMSTEALLIVDVFLSRPQTLSDAMLGDNLLPISEPAPPSASTGGDCTSSATTLLTAPPSDSGDIQENTGGAGCRFDQIATSDRQMRDIDVRPSTWSPVSASSGLDLGRNKDEVRDATYYYSSSPDLEVSLGALNSSTHSINTESPGPVESSDVCEKMDVDMSIDTNIIRGVTSERASPSPLGSTTRESSELFGPSIQYARKTAGKEPVANVSETKYFSDMSERDDIEIQKREEDSANAFPSTRHVISVKEPDFSKLRADNPGALDDAGNLSDAIQWPAEKIPTELHDMLNSLPAHYHHNPQMKYIFESMMEENTAEDEPTSPRIEICSGPNGPICPPWEFYYTNRIFYGKGVPRSNKKHLKGCDCDGPCDPTSKTCACVKRQMGWTGDDKSIKGFLYNKKGKVLNPGYPIFECNDACECSEECMNRVIQNGRQHQISLCLTKGKGWGVHADEKIPRGTYLGIYSGEMLLESEAAERGKLYDKFGRTYLFDLDFYYLHSLEADKQKVSISKGDGAPSASQASDNEEKSNLYTIDAFHVGNFTRFLNHSCDPNCVITPSYVNEPDLQKPTLTIFTTRDVKKGEELCFSYFGNNIEEEDEEEEEQVDEHGQKKKVVGGPGAHTATAIHRPCLCGASNCRGKMF